MRDEEFYLIVCGELDEVLFLEELSVVEGLVLKKLVKDNIYYFIFVDLKVYFKGEIVIDIEIYEEFKESKCEVVVLVVDV